MNAQLPSLGRLTPVAHRAHWLALLAVPGPGLAVMLADADVGSVITAAQSGAQWGYKLLVLQWLLVPILYVVQELTVRLGIFTGKGHGELIRETFGAGWAWLSVIGLVAAAMGALITEFSGVAGVGELFGIPRHLSLALAAGFLLAIVWTGSYRRIERVVILLGLLELVFFWVAWRAPVAGNALLDRGALLPTRDGDYWYLVAANVGAVVMPWMVFYQQSAVVDKKLRPSDYLGARWDTAVGAVLTQALMGAILVASAATLWKGGHGRSSLDTVGQIARALEPAFGPTLGRTLFVLGILGAAMAAATVVTLATAWGIGEVTHYKHSLDRGPSEALWFYAVFSAGVLGGAGIVALVPNLVTLSLGVEVMNGLLLPWVLGLLVILAVKALPPSHRLRGAYLWLVVGCVIATSVLGVYGGIRHIC